MNRKKQKLSVEMNDAKNDLDEHITSIEKEVAYKGAQLNLNNVLKEEEKEVIRKLKPELEKIGAQLNLEKEQLLKEKEQLLMEREQLEKLLKENEQLLKEKDDLLIKTEDFGERVITAEWKLADISNEVMKSNVAATNINSLPDEILLTIFSYIRQNEFGQIARHPYIWSLQPKAHGHVILNIEKQKFSERAKKIVCRRWNTLTRSPVLWKTVDVELYECQNEAAKMFLKTLPSCVSYIKMDFRNNEYWDSEGLNFEELCVCVRLQEKFSYLQTLILCEILFSHSLPSVIDLCIQFLQSVRRLAFYRSEFPVCDSREEYSSVSKIEALDVVKCYLDDFKIPQSLKMPSLTVLNLHCTEVSYSGLGTCFLNQLDISILNQLKVLNLGFTNIAYFSTFQSMLNHAVNLTELYLCNINLNVSRVKFDNLVFPHLKTICLRSLSGVTCEDVISFIQSCQSLENVYVDYNVAESYAKHSFVVANRCMLEILKVDSLCDEHHNMNYLRL